MALASPVNPVHVIWFIVASTLLAQLGLSVEDGGDKHNLFYEITQSDERIVQLSLILGIILVVLILLIRRFFKKKQLSTPPTIQLPSLPPAQASEISTHPSNTVPVTYVLRRLPEEIYKRFLVDTYSIESSNDFSHIDCMICNFPFVDGEELCILPVCRHVFHSHCTRSWFLNHDCRCTLCRHDYLDGFSDDQFV